MAQSRGYRPHNTSNPFAGFTQSSLHQPSHPQHSNANIQHNLGGHPGFAPNGGVNIFGPATGNTALPGAFGASAGLVGGGSGLASQAAQTGFAYGAALQQQHGDVAANSGSFPNKGHNSRIKEVWRHNLKQEFNVLRQLVEKYPYISMDTEFPGIVARPMGDFPSKASYHYQTLRTNVDMLRMIQLGITLFNVEGKEVAGTEIQNLRPGSYPANITICPCTWTFNFKFSPDQDMYNEESIAMLKKAGSDFEKHATQGIEIKDFGALLVTSGLAYNDDIQWISFHSGYDFGYLAKMMWCRKLPTDEEEYRDIIRIFFPNIWDVKFLLRHAQSLVRRGILGSQGTNIINALATRSGLQDLADELGCQRIGTQHQAGSDAWLTGSVFWSMKTKVFDGQLPQEVNGQMWGLTGVGGPATSATQALVLAAQGHTAAAAAAASNGMGSYHPSMRDGGPSTPVTNAAGLASTPGPSQPYQSSLTPGGGGVFGNFQYGDAKTYIPFVAARYANAQKTTSPYFPLSTTSSPTGLAGHAAYFTPSMPAGHGNAQPKVSRYFPPATTLFPRVPSYAKSFNPSKPAWHDNAQPRSPPNVPPTTASSPSGFSSHVKRFTPSMPAWHGNAQPKVSPSIPSTTAPRPSQPFPVLPQYTTQSPRRRFRPEQWGHFLWHKAVNGDMT